MKKRLELLKLDNYIGIYDPIKKKRLESLYPTKRVLIKRKATMFEGGYNTYGGYDLHKKLSGKKTISVSEYNKLKSKFKRTN